jgi:HTH-type transcriptional regulator/antitoxin HigA
MAGKNGVSRVYFYKVPKKGINDMTMKPIRTIPEYDAALSRIDELFDAKPGTVEGDELEVLTALVEYYEKKEFPIDPPNPVEAIQFRMKQQGLHPKDLIPYIGSASKVSEVLSGKRKLSITMIRKLHEGLRIPLEVLIPTS